MGPGQAHPMGHRARAGRCGFGQPLEIAVSWGGAGARGDEASCRVSTQRSLLLDPPPRLLRTTEHLWPVWKDWPVAGPQAKVRAACSP